MRDRVVEQYEDVLQNIEAAILSVHRRNPALLDYDVEGALEALVGDYTTELRGRTPPGAPAVRSPRRRLPRGAPHLRVAAGS